MHTFKDKLASLKAQSRYRSLALPGGIDLTSNDYLGLKDHPVLRQAALDFVQQDGALGSGGSRLLRGHMDAHAALEEFTATYFFAQKTLFFATGFQANYALFTALADRHSTIIYDELVHASARDGIRASDAKAFKARHNDIE